MSKNETLDLNKKSKDELINIAVEMKIELTGEESAQTLKGKIRRHLGIREEEFSAPKLAGKKAVINIPRTKETGAAVFVGHNGRPYRIQTGVDVEVPIELVGVLRDAKSFDFPEDPQTKQRIRVEVPTVNFSVVSMPR